MKRGHGHGDMDTTPQGLQDAKFLKRLEWHKDMIYEYMLFYVYQL